MAAGGSGTILLPQAGGSSQGARRPSRAFLIQQRDSGEETLVTLTPVVGGRLVNHNHPTSQVPTIVGPPTAQNLKSKGSMSSIESCHNNDLQVSPDALEAKRVEKLVRHLRRQASATGEDETRLNEWKRELENRDYFRRKSAVAEYLTKPAVLDSARRNSSCLPPPSSSTTSRMTRAHSQQGPERLELPIVTQGRIQRAYSHQGEVPIVLPTSSNSAHGSQKIGQYI